MAVASLLVELHTEELPPKSLARLNGRVYGAITQDPTVFGAYYNKQVLSKNGLSAPKSYADLDF